MGREERRLFSTIQCLSDPATLGSVGPVESLQSVSGEWSSPLASPSFNHGCTSERGCLPFSMEALLVSVEGNCGSGVFLTLVISYHGGNVTLEIANFK